eukprot:TRINITY_DN1021_c0_g1_i1.p1 TRINITY_DN1021_c0_g1~~TRINITY_DN1021_c0_g1_i1.p1  ORF type:complete len:196 (+),score=26.37 TRINITY_DN1021_c0_g1_i1:33-620(+)
MGCGKSQEGTNILFENSASQRKTKFKIVLLGNSGVGKSCVALRFAQDQYNDSIEPTVGAQFLTKKITINDQDVKFEIWDTAGQERFRSLGAIYFRNADAAIITFDITDQESFKGLQYWYDEVSKSVPDCYIIFAGNKSDLERDRKISKTEISKLAGENCGVMEISASTGENVKEMFYKIGHVLIAKKNARLESVR